YVVAPIGRPLPDFLTPIKTIGNWVIYRAKTSGYFDLVQSDLAFYGSKENFYRANYSWLNTGLLGAKQYPSIFYKKDAGQYREWVDIGREDLKLPPPEAFQKQTDNGQITFEKVEGQVYGASVKVENPCYLLFKMTYHPYWHALVDGAEKETVMLSPSFI